MLSSSTSSSTPPARLRSGSMAAYRSPSAATPRRPPTRRPTSSPSARKPGRLAIRSTTTTSTSATALVASTTTTWATPRSSTSPATPTATPSSGRLRHGKHLTCRSDHPRHPGYHPRPQGERWHGEHPAGLPLRRQREQRCLLQPQHVLRYTTRNHGDRPNRRRRLDSHQLE